MIRGFWFERDDGVREGARQGAAIGLVAGALALSPMAAGAAVFGSDDRGPLAADLGVLADSVGLVSSEPERTLCTGFCVGRRTVATAAHCLFRTAGERKPDLASFRFVVGAAGARRVAGILGRAGGALGQHVIAGSTNLRVTPPIDATRDWALMRLDQPVCRGHSLFVDKIAPLRVSRLAARGRIVNVAFHGDLKNWRLAASRNCDAKTRMTRSVRRQMDRDFSDTSALVLHECDTGLASSGSPLLAIGRGNRLKVVAMNVGTYQQTRYLVTGDSVKRRYKPATVANTAVAGSAFADPVLAFTRADILAAPRAVRRLQAALNKTGFEAGRADGIFGARTRAAVIAFERATDRPTIGLATRQLLRAAERYARQ